LALVVAFGLLACGDAEDQSDVGASFAESAAHIHGLGVNPADQSLYIATHSGLYRSAQGTSTPEPVGESTQDTMGFSVAGPDHFLGSGHPGPGEDGPPNLGLIESVDGGRSWQEVSLGSQADFHVLRYAGERIYGFNGLTGLLMVSSDGGEKFRAVGRLPDVPVAVLAASRRELYAALHDGTVLESQDGGRTWARRVSTNPPS
jgi:photosystem II stability/assembly factor-like uncharacterized protein